MMTVYRIARVRTTELSPVARLEAVDAEGHELNLEVPVALAQQAAGRVLVLQWSLHDLPATPDIEASHADQLGFEAAKHTVTGQSVDQAFMALMGRARQDASDSGASGPNFHIEAPASTAGRRDILDEFNTLLGSPGGKVR